MHRCIFLTIAITAPLLNGCNASSNSDAPSAQQRAAAAKRLLFTYDSLAPTEYHPVQTGGTFHADIQGVWQARGYGFVFDIRENDFNWYSATANHTWDHTPDEPIDMVFAIQDSSGRCYLKPYDTESAIILEPLDKLPERFRESPVAGPVATLERIDEIMTELFPFFEVRDHDWTGRMAAARSQVTNDTTPAELFAIAETVFDGLGDGHTSLMAEIDGESQETTGSMSSIRRALEADFQRHAVDVERGAYFSGWSERLFEGIHQTLLHGESQSAFDENIIWGKIQPEVGYLLVRDMATFGDEDADLVATLGDLHRQLENIFDSFAGCEAVIIDVSFNRGGYHSFALAFASHIADRERYALCKYPKGHPDLLQKFHIVPYCDRRGTIKTFTKPVYVVTTDACVSAGEEFVMAARPFPHVTVVGTPTQGMLSDILGKPLPNGWVLGMSNEIFLDHKGACFEAVGVPVDIERSIFNVDNISEVGHAASIGALADEIQKGKASTGNES